MSVAQQMSALQRANEVRYARADIKRRLQKREMSVGDLLTDVPACVRKVAIGELLMWLPGYGRTRVLKALSGVASPTVPAAHLGEFTRERIIERVGR